MTLETLVLAVRREARSEAPEDWQERVRQTPGVISTASSGADRMQIVACPEAVEAIRPLLGDYLHIERVEPRHVFGAAEGQD